MGKWETTRAKIPAATISALAALIPLMITACPLKWLIRYCMPSMSLLVCLAAFGYRRLAHSLFEKCRHKPALCSSFIKATIISVDGGAEKPPTYRLLRDAQISSAPLERLDVLDVTTSEELEPGLDFFFRFRSSSSTDPKLEFPLRESSWQA